MAQFGLRGYFLKSSQANFCQIRYSSCVCGVQLKQMIQINKFLENGDTVLMIVNQQLAKQQMNLDLRKKMLLANFHLRLVTKRSMLAQWNSILMEDFGVRLKGTNLEDTFQEIMVIVQMTALNQ